jgi:hypothetical protein
MPILAQLASGHVLDTAYEWLCRRRRDYSANSDVWAFRRDWQAEMPAAMGPHSIAVAPDSSTAERGKSYCHRAGSNFRVRGVLPYSETIIKR